MKIRPYTDTIEYNCFGYAFDKKEWLDFYCIDDSAYENHTVKDYYPYMVTELRKRFHLMPVTERYVKARTNKNETIIAFRVSDDDFHFCVRKNGKWSMKKGCYCIYDMSQKEVLAKVWCPERNYPYDSPIKFFIKIQKNT